MCMILKCYLSFDTESLEPVWAFIRKDPLASLSAHPLGCLVWIPDRYISWALLTYPELERRPRHDYYV